MAELLKDKYSIQVAKDIAYSINQVYAPFDSSGFVKHVAQGFDELELMARAAKIAQSLGYYLPQDFAQSVNILLASLKVPIELDANNNMAGFWYLPHNLYVAQHGLHDFELSMSAFYHMTQKFSCEFAIRPFIQAYPTQAIALFKQWAKDPNLDVRRLVSEGTRTRLPWAKQLPEFIQDPSPVIQLLELLKDDSELYVRRSVANNLNDIGKDHPNLLTEIAARWWKGANAQRKWLVKHALRSAIKRADVTALQILGYQQNVELSIQGLTVSPTTVVKGQSVELAFSLTNQSQQSVALMVDFALHFVKANGQSKPKVFKLKALQLAAQSHQDFVKKISFKPMTTRTLYSGVHKLEVIVNGKVLQVTDFYLDAGS
ncbi:DNA alkylation repair protein [Paraglaciecola aestuariivivens]